MAPPGACKTIQNPHWASPLTCILHLFLFSSYYIHLDKQISAFNPTTNQLLKHHQPIEPAAAQSPMPSPMQPPFGAPIPDILENQPVVLDNSSNGNLQQHQTSRQQSTSSSAATNNNSNSSSGNNNNGRIFSLFGYLLVLLFIAVVFMTIAFVASSLRNSSSSAGAAFKSLGNFTALSGASVGSSKYNKHQRRQDMLAGTGGPGSSLHSSNKDLLVINNSNGHQFLYAPASTKISSSSSTHILAALGANATTTTTTTSTGAGHHPSHHPNQLGTGQSPAHHQGSLHRVQHQQQMYSGNGASLSAAGTQSNNYYYGLMGLTPLFQQQQQQQYNQQQISQTQSYNQHHQANKSTVSTESANSSSSSGVESGSTSVQQQQQHQQQHPQTQPACLVTTSGNNDFNMINGQFASAYGHAAAAAQQNLFNSSANFQPTTLTQNAHYSTSAVPTPAAINLANAHQMHHRQASNQMRDHIYETVDYEKPCMSRLLMPTHNGNELQFQQHFGTMGHHQHQMYQQQQQQHQLQQQQADNHRTLTLSSRLLNDAMQQQQRSLFQQPAIVREHQVAAKTNIICSKMAQVTPQRATEIGKSSFGNGGASNGQHDMMTIFNGADSSVKTATQNGTSASSANSSSCYDQQQRLELSTDGGNSNSKLSTDC